MPVLTAGHCFTNPGPPLLPSRGWGVMGRTGERSETSRFPRTAPGDVYPRERTVDRRQSLTVVPVPGCAPQGRQTASLNPRFILLLPRSAGTMRAEHCALWVRSAWQLQGSPGAGPHEPVLEVSPDQGQVCSRASEVTSRTQCLADLRTQRLPFSGN